MEKQKYVLQIWEGGKYVTKTKPADYWDTCKAADKYMENLDRLEHRCRIVEHK